MFIEVPGPPGYRKFRFWTGRSHAPGCDSGHSYNLSRLKPCLELGDKFVGYPGPFGVVIEILPNDEYVLEQLFSAEHKVNLFDDEGKLKEFRVNADGTTTIRCVLKPARQLRCVVDSAPVPI
jgi:hypothetical protein